jgi:hypothetical protein
MKRNPSMKTIAGFCVALLFSVVMIGCSDSGTTTTETKPVTPKAGSSYTYQKHTADSTSGGSMMTTDSQVVATIVSSGLTVHGHDNVITSYDNWDTVYYAIESNGDVSLYVDKFSAFGYSIANPNPWLTFPFGSKSDSIQVVTVDTNISVGGLPIAIQVRGVMHYNGTETLTGSTSASGGVATFALNITASAAGGFVKFSVLGNQRLAYDPSIGNYFHYTKDLTVPDVAAAGITGGTQHTEKTLVSYNLVK